jgi:uncharacterized membrane protein YsdA (DUF1294 family)
LIPALAAAWYSLLSVAAAGLYAWDKGRARRGGRRISERTLHWAAVLGGWPGALVARALLRHKTRRRSFTIVLWGSAALHAIVWVRVLGYR